MEGGDDTSGQVTGGWVGGWEDGCQGCVGGVHQGSPSQASGTRVHLLRLHRVVGQAQVFVHAHVRAQGQGFAA